MTEYSDHPHHPRPTTINGRSGPVSIAPGLPLAVDAYRHHIEHLGLSKDQERQIIEAVAFFILSFVDQGFGVHPAQLACGKLEVLLATMAGTDSDGSRKKNQHLTSTFNKVAFDRKDGAR